MGDGACGMGATFDGTDWTDLCAGTAANSPERADFIARAFIEKGYNTNYVAGWYLVRSALKLTFDDTAGTTNFIAGSDGNAKGLAMTRGPLTRRIVESSKIPSSNIPLIGDAAPGDPGEAFLTTTIAKSPATGTWTTVNDETSETFFEAGERLVESFNDGPATYNSTSFGVGLIPGGQDVSPTMAAEQSLGGSVPAVDGAAWLQDTRDWFAIHRGTCNILMADGSVKNFVDQNGDLYLNPGFPIPKGLTEAQYDQIGYRNDVKELHEARIFSGVFLENAGAKAVDLETSF
jgi:prepilin-type processing-associated H-X9-DG protein